VKLIVMLDVSGSMEGNLPLLRAAASELFARLRPDDVARVGTFGHEVTLSPSFTRDVRELEAALPSEIAPDAPTPLWRAIDEALDAFGPARSQRTVILVLSDGKDAAPPSFRRRPISQSEIIDRARREDVMIYAVAMRSRRSRAVPPGLGPGDLQAMLVADLPDPGLGRVADETGGGYIEIRFGQDLASAFGRVAEELHSQYYSVRSAGSQWQNRINVRTAKSDLSSARHTWRRGNRTGQVPGQMERLSGGWSTYADTTTCSGAQCRSDSRRPAAGPASRPQLKVLESNLFLLAPCVPLRRPTVSTLEAMAMPGAG
jgi:hypothetical protein